MRRHIPIICGGTGYYIKTLLEDYEFISVASDLEKSGSLESLSREELYERLKLAGIWEDHHWVSDSKRRMARALEKASCRQKPRFRRTKFRDNYIARIYSTRVNRQNLRQKIRVRLEARLKEGLIDEVEELLKRGTDPQFLDSLGLEYRWTSRFLKGKLTMAELIERLHTDICRYAKRQNTFLRYLQKSGHEIHHIQSWEFLRKDVLDWLNRPGD